MPLSKARNRERMRQSRLHKRLNAQLGMRLRERKLKPIRLCEGLITRHIKTLGQLLPSTGSKPVQPKVLIDTVLERPVSHWVDADGNAIYGD